MLCQNLVLVYLIIAKQMCTFQSKTIEIFGDHGIYIGTFQGHIVEESDEFYVYQFTINFGNKINKELSVHVSRRTSSQYITMFWPSNVII